jgi:hypothetical protein
VPYPGIATYPGTQQFPGIGVPVDPGDPGGTTDIEVTARMTGRRVEAAVMETIPRESVELLALTVKVNGFTTTAYETSVVLDPGRPVTWTPAAVVGVSSGPMLSGLAPGLYRVYVRVTDVSESPVVEAGWVWVS